MTIKKRLYWSASLYLLLSIHFVHASYLEVTLLGTGTPRPDISRFGPSTVIEAKGRYFVFDSGRGTTIRLQQAGIPLAQIEQVFITHLHSDHVSGLPDLWLSSWIWQRQNKLHIYGPVGIQNMTDHIKLAFQADLDYRIENSGLNPLTAEINTTEIKSEGVIYNKEGVQITAFFVDHGLVKPAFGYRLDSGDRSVVISGDTSYSENLIKFAKGTDLLIHEVAAADETLLQNNRRLQKIIRYHTSPDQAAMVFNKVQPRVAIYSHLLLFGINEQQLLEKTKSLYQGAVYIGEDLLKIGVGKNITVYPTAASQ
ncbi:MAG: MBL fold metallo-hydrolase [Piscirickettsiaceae bacterium]|nr:MBL fold metallo-hydrolase [Piscirickettsiaceae bacterium]